MDQYSIAVITVTTPTHLHGHEGSDGMRLAAADSVGGEDERSGHGGLEDNLLRAVEHG
jgi:hypothetical protein